MLDPLFLNEQSVINNDDILFKFRMYSQYNGQNSGSLNMLFPHDCTELSMLSTNFLVPPSYIIFGVSMLPHSFVITLQVTGTLSRV